MNNHLPLTTLTKQTLLRTMIQKIKLYHEKSNWAIKKSKSKSITQQKTKKKMKKVKIWNELYIELEQRGRCDGDGEGKGRRKRRRRRLKLERSLLVNSFSAMKWENGVSVVIKFCWKKPKDTIL